MTDQSCKNLLAQAKSLHWQIRNTKKAWGVVYEPEDEQTALAIAFAWHGRRPVSVENKYDRNGLTDRYLITVWTNKATKDRYEKGETKTE